MKQLSIILLLFLGCSICSNAQQKLETSNVVEEAKFFLTQEELPDAAEYLPAPPKTTDLRFINDSVVYEEGKRLRNTPRGKEAIEDASISVDYVMKRFGKVMGKDLTPEKYPVLADFLYRTYQTARMSVTRAKDIFKRQRPYQYFKEHTPIPEHEMENDWTSYPSGHTSRFWCSALVLSVIDPAHQNEILKLGYEMGKSRTIVGYHYQSDVDAACMAASVAFARICNTPEWQKCYKKALKEFRKK